MIIETVEFLCVFDAAQCNAGLMRGGAFRVIGVQSATACLYCVKQVDNCRHEWRVWWKQWHWHV